MSILSAIIACLSVIILSFGLVSPLTGALNPKVWMELFHELFQIPSLPLYALEAIALCLVSLMASLFQVYVSMAVGHLAGRHRIMMSVVAYLVINTAVNFIFGIGMMAAGTVFYNLPVHFNNETGIHLVLLGRLAVSLIQFAVYFFGTERILSKRLNLE